MKDIHVFHYALNCLYLKGDKVVLAEDEYRIFDDTQRALFNDFLSNFWQKIMGTPDSLLITPANQDRIAELIRREGVNNLNPFSVHDRFDPIEFLLNLFNARLYGSQEDPRDIFEAIVRFKSKVKSYELWRAIDPSFLSKDYEVVDLGGLEAVIKKLLKTGKVVVKGEYGQMGMNSQIIDDNPDIEGFIRKSSSQSFIATQEVRKPGLFIVEPFFEHKYTPALCYHITDTGVRFNYTYDRVTDNLECVGISTPSESPSIQRILEQSLKYCRLLQSIGYRGPVDFEFMESIEGDVRFCEVNARYPIEYYPFEFPLDGKPYRWSKFRLAEPNLSFELLNRNIGDYWFNPKNKIGVIPLNIPYFLEPQRRFALVFVGDSKPQIEEMYQAASVLQSPK